MSTKEIRQYFHSTKNSTVRSDLAYAISLVGNERIAIDCGCGAGSDIDYLRKNNFTVYAFDIEEDAIRLCHERFKEDSKVRLSRAGFSSFIYPQASLIVADASLFFCPPDEFDVVWKKMTQSLVSDARIFCGSFLGHEDTMAGLDYDRAAFWPDVLVFTEKELRQKFAGYDILKWTEHKETGETAQGVPHDWHIFSVVAKLRNR